MSSTPEEERKFYSLRDVLKLMPPEIALGDILDNIAERTKFTEEDIRNIQLQVKQVSISRLFEQDPTATVELGSLLNALPEYTTAGDILQATKGNLVFNVRDALDVIKAIRENTGKRLMNEIHQDNARQDKLFAAFYSDSLNKFPRAIR